MMELLSNFKAYTLIPTGCKICDKLCMSTVHTKYGHLYICESHSNEELEKLKKDGVSSSGIVIKDSYESMESQHGVDRGG